MNEQGIFLCYRRDDSQGFARGIYDRLSARYGHERVFRDIGSVPPGVQFPAWIASRVKQCSVMIVLIGKRWLSIKDAAGQRRLSLPKDWVRIEIKAALDSNVPIIPVLVQGASMPSQAKLPSSIAGLATFNAAEIADSRWDYDIEKLFEAIDALTLRSVFGQLQSTESEEAVTSLSGRTTALGKEMLSKQQRGNQPFSVSVVFVDPRSSVGTSGVLQVRGPGRWLGERVPSRILVTNNGSETVYEMVVHVKDSRSSELARFLYDRKWRIKELKPGRTGEALIFSSRGLGDTWIATITWRDSSGRNWEASLPTGPLLHW